MPAGLGVAEEAGEDDDLALGARVEVVRQALVGFGQHLGVAEVVGHEEPRLLRVGVLGAEAAGAEGGGDDLRGVVLARGLHQVHEARGLEVLVRGDAGVQVGADLVHHGGVQAQALADLVVAGDDGVAHLGGVALGQAAAGALDEQVGDLGVAFVSLAGRGDHDDAAGGIGGDDVADLRDLGGVGDGRPAELADFHGCGDSNCVGWVKGCRGGRAWSGRCPAR